MMNNTLVIYDSLSRPYTVTRECAPKEFYSVYVPRDKRRISVSYDMEIRVGGFRMYINKDGEMVKGYNMFDQESLARVYAFLV